MVCLTRDVINWSRLREWKILLTHPLLLITPECVRKDLCAYWNYRLTGFWEHRLRSSLKLRRTQQLFHFPCISTQQWCWEPALCESQFISHYCKQGRQQTQAPPLLFLDSASAYISIADAKTGSTFLDHVRALSKSKTSHILPKPGLQRKTEGCPFGRHITHLRLWQEIHPGSNSVWVSFTLEKYHLFIFLPWTEANCCKRIKCLPLPFYIEAAHHMR